MNITIIKIIVIFLLFLVVAVTPLAVSYYRWLSDKEKKASLKNLNLWFKDGKNWMVAVGGLVAWFVATILVLMLWPKPKPMFVSQFRFRPGPVTNKLRESRPSEIIGGSLYEPIQFREMEEYDVEGELPGYRGRKKHSRSRLPHFVRPEEDPRIMLRQMELIEQKNR